MSPDLNFKYLGTATIPEYSVMSMITPSYARYPGLSTGFKPATLDQLVMAERALKEGLEMLSEGDSPDQEELMSDPIFAFIMAKPEYAINEIDQSYEQDDVADVWWSEYGHCISEATPGASTRFTNLLYKYTTVDEFHKLVFDFIHDELIVVRERLLDLRMSAQNEPESESNTE